MSSPTRLIVRGAPLSPTFKGTLNEFYKAMLDRLEVLSPFGQLQFQVGGVQPTSNVGPWLKDGSEWWVWDEAEKTYVPITINPGSLADFLSITAFNTAIANYSTTTEMNAAIAAAVGGTTFNTYPAQATLETTPQSIPLDSTPHRVEFESAPVNPAPSPWNVGAGRYIAPAAGVYMVSASAQFDNATGVAANMQIGIGVFKNGTDAGLGSADSTPSPTGARWFPEFGGLLITLAQNDYLELWVNATDGASGNTVNLTTVDFSVVKVG